MYKHRNIIQSDGAQMNENTYKFKILQQKKKKIVFFLTDKQACWRIDKVFYMSLWFVAAVLNK